MRNRAVAVVGFVVVLCLSLSRGTGQEKPADSRFPPELVQFVSGQKSPVFTAGPKGAWDAKIRERGWIMREDGKIGRASCRERV